MGNFQNAVKGNGGKVDYSLELLLISENKIKISLTKEDLDAHGITSDDIDYDNTETRRVFWTLLDEVKNKTGFDAAKTRIFIQIYPMRDGGCELYVSKIKETGRRTGTSASLHNSGAEKSVIGDSDADEEKHINEGGILNTPEAKRKTESDTFAAIYCFDEMISLLLVCKRLNALGYSGVSSAFSEEKRLFFLSLEIQGERHSFIEEYGKKLRTESALLYVKEHCTPICEGEAVKYLCEL